MNSVAVCRNGRRGWAVTEYPRVAEVAEVWTRTKIVSPNIRYFVAIIRFVAIYAIFGDLWAKKVPFWVKNSAS